MEISEQTFDSREGWVQLFCPSKLNLGLKIVGRTPQNYHLLESLFWPINFGDTLWVKESRNWKLSIEWATNAAKSSQLPQEKENLLYRMWEFLGVSPPKIEVNLIKRTPIGGGLGGGSSNVATLAKWWSKQSPTPLDLSSLTELGADIPFFLNSPISPCWVTGIGENLKPLKISEEVKELFFLLIIPPVACQTGKVFARYAQTTKDFSKSSEPPVIGWPQLTQWFQEMQNDLSEPATSEAPQLKQILETLAKIPCLARGLSGSGSTCFLVFKNRREGHVAAKALEPFFRITNCKSVSAHTYLET